MEVNFNTIFKKNKLLLCVYKLYSCFVESSCYLTALNTIFLSPKAIVDFFRLYSKDRAV